MYYFESIDYDSHKDINNLIDICVDFHINNHNDHYIDEKFYSCNSFFRYFSISLHQQFTNATNVKVFKREYDYSKLRRCFSWLPIYLVKNNLENTIQHGRIPEPTILKSKCKSTFPDRSAHRRHDPVATDTVFYDSPTIDDRDSSEQIFIRRTLYSLTCVA